MSNYDILKQRYCRHYSLPRVDGAGCPDCNAETAMIERINALPIDECIKIMNGKRIKRLPWAMIAEHEAQAQYNHGQTLIALNHRGGLCPAEALSIIMDRRWRDAIRDDLAAEIEMINRLMEREAP